MYLDLKERVLNANLDLVKYGLVTLTWGNVSEIDRNEGMVAVKPSGVSYDEMDINDIVIVDLSGEIIEGTLNPSSDLPTHLELYKSFSSIGGIAHSHSESATIFAQACKEIPCFGTTHADHFYGPVPVTRFLTEAEVNEDYEGNTGKVIIELFNDIDPVEMPGVLVAGHGPFTWGESCEDAMKNNLILERTAKMAMETIRLNPDAGEIPKYILDKHYKRKHGPDAYYGQNNS